MLADAGHLRQLELQGLNLFLFIVQFQMTALQLSNQTHLEFFVGFVHVRQWNEAVIVLREIMAPYNDFFDLLIEEFSTRANAFLNKYPTERTFSRNLGIGTEN